MPELRIPAETRSEFGKGAARRIRRANLVPAVLYGHGEPPVHLSMPGHDLMLALKNPNALLTIVTDDGDHLAIPKAVQRDPIKGFLEHVDLLTVRRGEKVTVEIGVAVHGEAAPETMVNHELTTLTVEAEATHIPTGLEINIDGLDVGDHVTAGDVSLPSGSTLVTDPEHVVVSILAQPTAEALEAELSEAEAEAGVEREQPTEEEPAEGAEAGADEAAGGDAAPDES